MRVKRWQRWSAAAWLLIGLWCAPENALAGEIWTLQRAVQQALSDNPDARLASQRIAAARAGLQQANAAFWPTVQLESSYALTNNPAMVFGSILNQRSFTPDLDFNDVPDVDNFNVKGTLSVPLFAGGSNLAGKDSAVAQTEAAKHQAQAVRHSLAFEVSRAFYSVLKTRAFERAAEAAVRAFELNRSIAQKRFAAGTALKADVLDVEVRLARAQEDLIRVQNARRLGRHALRNLIGIDRGELELDDNVTAVPVRVPAERDLSGRSEIAATQEQIHAAEAGLRRAKGGYWPQVAAFASLAYDAGLELGGDNLSYMAGVRLNWQLWDGLATHGKVAQASAGLKTAHEQRRKVRLVLDLELAQARIRLKEATERLAVNAKAIAQAEESVQLTRARFEQGLALASQLIDAETALTAVRVRRAESEANQRIAVAALRKALGLPQFETNKQSAKDGGR